MEADPGPGRRGAVSRASRRGMVRVVSGAWRCSDTRVHRALISISSRFWMGLNGRPSTRERRSRSLRSRDKREPSGIREFGRPSELACGCIANEVKAACIPRVAAFFVSSAPTKEPTREGQLYHAIVQRSEQRGRHSPDCSVTEHCSCHHVDDPRPFRSQRPLLSMRPVDDMHRLVFRWFL